MGLSERRDIVRLCRESGAGDGVCFSLVGISGSSEQFHGFRMVAMADGKSAGRLSEALLSGELLQRGMQIVEAGPVVASLTTPLEADLLAESLGTPEADALIEAMEATLQGDFRLVATVLPKDNIVLRIVLDAIGDVLFASDALSTPDIVDVRTAALKSTHGSLVEYMGNRIFVERMEPAETSQTDLDSTPAVAEEMILSVAVTQ